jgi:hypothetical protein
VTIELWPGAAALALEQHQAVRHAARFLEVRTVRWAIRERATITPYSASARSNCRRKQTNNRSHSGITQAASTSRGRRLRQDWARWGLVGSCGANARGPHLAPDPDRVGRSTIEQPLPLRSMNTIGSIIRTRRRATAARLSTNGPVGDRGCDHEAMPAGGSWHVVRRIIHQVAPSS